MTERLRKTCSNFSILSALVVLLAIVMLSPAQGWSDTKLQQEESELAEKINSSRLEMGVNDLYIDGTLTAIAEKKAQHMAENNYLRNFSSRFNLRDMLRDEGASYENIEQKIMRTHKSVSATRVQDILMRYSSHRNDFLNENYNLLGVGIAGNSQYKYIVEIFARGNETPPSEDEGSPGNEGDTGETEPGPGQDPGAGSGNDDPAQPGQGDDNTNPGTSPGSDPVDEGDEQQDEQDDVQGLTADEQQMLNKVNNERSQRGLHELKANLELTEVARVKARDMIENGYFSHTSPTYGSPFDMMNRFGIDYSYAGENLAGASTVSRAHTSLMNSQGHRANILNRNFDQVGIGVVDGGPYGKMFVQMFIK